MPRRFDKEVFFVKHLLKTIWMLGVAVLSAAGISNAADAAGAPAVNAVPIICQSGNCTAEDVLKLLNQCGGACAVNGQIIGGSCGKDACKDGGCQGQVTLDDAAVKDILERLGIGDGQIPEIVTVIPNTDSSPSGNVTAPTDTPSENVSTPTDTPSGNVTTPTDTQSGASAELSEYEQQVVVLVNEVRAKNGLSPLKANAVLSKSARAKSQDMHDKHYFSHTSPTYGSPFDMMKQFGITYRSAGENIAMGQQTPQAVMDAWMNSEGHRANILNPSFREIGVGYVADGHYWTQQFIG